MANIDKLFYRIAELGLSAKKVSDATNISTGNLSDWKSGRCMPSAEKLEKLAEYLNCSVDYLLGRSDTPQPFELTENEQSLISGYKNLSAENKTKAAEYIKALAEEDTNNKINITGVYGDDEREAAYNTGSIYYSAEEREKKQKNDDII